MNRAELYIGLLKESVQKDTKDSDTPLVFWDHWAESHSQINNLTAIILFQLEGRNAHFYITGEDGDISNLYQFAWYAWCYYHDHTPGFLIQQEILGRVLGPYKVEANEMAQWILNTNGRVVPSNTAVPMTTAQLNNETEKNKRTISDQCISKLLGTSMSPPLIIVDTTTENLHDPYGDHD